MTRDLIVFGEDWGRHPSSTQHLIRHLSNDRRVIWVNSIGMRRPKLSRADAGRALSKIAGAVRRPRKQTPVPVPENMTVINPLAVPLPGNRAAARINRAVLGRKVRRAVEMQGLREPLMWASLPTAVDLAGACGDRDLVYYCGDDFGALAGVDHQPVTACEERLAAKADVIFAASETLAQRFDGSKTFHLPHGAHIDLFSRPAPRAHDLPTHGPIAGFYGSLSDWLDQDLVAACAARLPEWTFVFIGDERTDLERLKSLPNVQFLGPRAHEKLPCYVQHWDASLLPFVDNAQIRACNPLKLREYLAAGRPIVATPFPAVRAYADHIKQAGDVRTFAAAIEICRSETDVHRQRRQKSVETESWQARADEVRAHIDRL